MPLGLLPFILLVIPVLEIGAFIVIGQKIGIAATLAMIVVTAVIGSFLLRMQGRSDWQLQPLRAVADFEWPKPDKRREFQRARLAHDADGVPRVTVHPSRSSGVLSSVTWANGLVVIPEGRKLQRGDTVAFLPFCELLT